MSLVAEFETALPVLREALRAAPGTRLRHETIDLTPEEDVRWVFWATGGDRSSFDRALATDPTVEEFAVLAGDDDPRRDRLYRTTHAGRLGASPLRVAIERDVQILDATHDVDGTTVRARCPSREAFAALKGAIEDAYGRFVTHSLYRPRSDADERGRYGVTPAQREALLFALEAGYFDVPRRTTVVEMADELGISDQALSARLRRGERNVLERTLASRDGA
jgi:hypothetical protein